MQEELPFPALILFGLFFCVTAYQIQKKRIDLTGRFHGPDRVSIAAVKHIRQLY
jgi:hypothetical protein